MVAPDLVKACLKVVYHLPLVFGYAIVVFDPFLVSMLEAVAVPGSRLTVAALLQRRVVVVFLLLPPPQRNKVA